VPTLFESAKNNQPKSGKAKAMKPKTDIRIPHPHMGPFTSFARHPDGVRFETQEEQETVILFLRQHIVVNIPWIFIAIVMAIAPTIVFPVLFTVLHVSLPIPGTYIFIGTIFWYVATFGFILAEFLGWLINIYIVTNERIVDIDFYYLLYKKFCEAEIVKIQDISYRSKGIFAALFNFGDVTIETAGEAPNLTFESVPHPEQVVETIRNILEGHEVSV
jgi:hypothetical protein